jgi:hypothetical protein
LRHRRGWRFGVGEGAASGGTGQLHGEVSQLGAHGQVAQGAFVGFLRLRGLDGVQDFGALVG